MALPYASSSSSSNMQLAPGRSRHHVFSLEGLVLAVATFFFRYASTQLSRPILLLLQTLANTVPRDLLFAFGVVRVVYEAAWIERCTELVGRRLFSQQVLEATFRDYPCHLPSELRELVLDAASQARVCQQSAAPPRASSSASGEDALPAVERILLTGPGTNARHAAAVASSIACEVEAPLLVIDKTLLEHLSSCVKGGWSASSVSVRGSNAVPGKGKQAQVFPNGPDALNDLLTNCEEASRITESDFEFFKHSVAAFFSSGTIAFEINVLRKAMERLRGPMVIYLPNVDQSVCSSTSIANAFREAFVGCHVTLIGHYATSDNHALKHGAYNEELDVSPLQMALGSGLPLFQNSEGSGRLLGDSSQAEDSADEKEDLLKSVFPTHLKLKPPLAGRHRQLWKNQLKEEKRVRAMRLNFSRLQEAASAKNVECPPSESNIYEGKELSSEEWGMVLAWAIRRELTNWTNREERRLVEEDKRFIAQETKEALLQIQNSHVQDCPVLEDECSETQEKVEDEGKSPLKDIVFTANTDLEAIIQRYLRTCFPRAMRALRGFAIEYGKLLIQQHNAKLGNRKDYGLELHKIRPIDQVVKRGTVKVKLTEEDILYGMNMLARCDNGSRQKVAPANSFERALTRNVIYPEDVETSLSDVGALEKAKMTLREAVHLPLLLPEVFSKGSLARACKGVLLFGPPGTGKSLLARATAAECGAAFMSLEPSSLVSKWQGDSVRYVRAAFALAKKMAPTVIFIDEVDALLSTRNANEHEALRELKNELMAHWDGVRSSSESSIDDRVMVLGATNRPQDLDEAVLRRFSRRVLCDLPDAKGREEILRVLLTDENLKEGFDLAALSTQLNGYSGSDLRNICTAAAMIPLREVLKENGGAAPQSLLRKYRSHKIISNDTSDLLRPLSIDDFLAAKKEVSPSVGEDTFQMNELRRWNEQYGDNGRSSNQRLKLSYYL